MSGSKNWGGKGDATFMPTSHGTQAFSISLARTDMGHQFQQYM